MSAIHNEAPQIGAFLRPVGRWYRYCYRVLAVHQEDRDGPEVIVAERMGIAYATAHRIRTGQAWRDYGSPFAGLMR